MIRHVGRHDFHVGISLNEVADSAHDEQESEDPLNNTLPGNRVKYVHLIKVLAFEPANLGPMGYHATRNRP